MSLPGGSPGPHANIPAPWRLINITAGVLATIIMGFIIRAALHYSDGEKSRSIEQWSIEWNQNRKE
jgi:hypothetical protein